MCVLPQTHKKKIIDQRQLWSLISCSTFFSNLALLIKLWCAMCNVLYRSACCARMMCNMHDLQHACSAWFAVVSSSQNNLQFLHFLQQPLRALSIYILCNCLFVCPFVSNKRQNGWTDQAHFFVGPRVTPGKVYGWSNFQKLASIKIWLIFFCKSTNFFFNSRFFLFTMYTKRKHVHNWNRK